MVVFTYSQARQNFSRVLELAKEDGEVIIRRSDGSIFSIHSEKAIKSPLDVKGIKSKITTKEIIAFIRESRER
ncbi:type II toxin-antitoxin system Phd/YefM family antitoxin [bacterium]